MTVLEFLGYKECDQWELFYEDSEFLYEIIAIDAHYQLYRLNDFYVELTMVPETYKGLRMNPMLFGPRLDKYLDPDDVPSQVNSVSSTTD